MYSDIVPARVMHIDFAPARVICCMCNVLYFQVLLESGADPRLFADDGNTPEQV